MRNRTPVVLAVAILAAFVAGDARADPFEDGLRSALHLPPSATVVWPPRAGLSAGSVVGPDLRVTSSGEAHVETSPPVGPDATVAIPRDRLAPSSAFWEWRSLLVDPPSVKVSLALSSPRIASIPAPESSGGRTVGATDGLVRRAWVATMSIVVEPGDGMTPAQWLDVQEAASRDERATYGPGGRSLVLHVPGPTALALDLPPVARAGSAGRDGPVQGPRRWALATVASGVYPALPLLDQDWNQVSADAVADALAPWRPTTTATLRADRATGLRRDGVLAFLDGFVRSAKRAGAQLLVVYYVGHMERSGTGSLSLLMGDAPRRPERHEAIPPGASGNLSDIARAVDRAASDLAPSPGTLDVGTVHWRLGASGLPFVLLVDGCLEDRSYDEARKRLGIVVDAQGGEPVYVGDGDAGRALREQIARLQDYPSDLPWLRSRDPTILGATPGTVAFVEGNPTWELGGGVGPIARRLSDVVARTRMVTDRPPLIRILGFAADRQEVGEQELQGTVSWSDWLPILRRFDAASFRR